MKKPNNDIIHVFTLSTFEQISKTAPASEWENLIPKYDLSYQKSETSKKMLAIIVTEHIKAIEEIFKYTLLLCIAAFVVCICDFQNSN